MFVQRMRLGGKIGRLLMTCSFSFTFPRAPGFHSFGFFFFSEGARLIYRAASTVARRRKRDEEKVSS